MIRRVVAASAALGLAVLAGPACSTPPAPVSLSAEWPGQVGGYGDVTAAWTRRGEVRQGWDQVLEVYATFKSPAWRTAYVQRRARVERLSAASSGQLLAAEREAAGKHHEVQLLVSTHDSRENDLSKHPRSMWTVALVAGDGARAEPTSIDRDRRPVHMIRGEFPRMGDFAEAYVAKFPADLAILGDGATRFSLVISSPRGSTELVWSTAP